MFKSKSKKKVAPAAQPEPEPPAAERRLSQDKQEVQMMRGISDFQMEGVVDVDADEQSDLELLIDMVKDGCSAAEIAAEATPENCAYTNSKGATALHYATKMGNKAVLAALCKSGCDANAAQPNGKTCMHIACQYGFTECAVALSAAGADVNRTDMNGLTPLHMCVQNNQKDTALLLVTDLMADYDIKNNEGMAALEYSRFLGSDEIANSFAWIAKYDNKKSTEKKPEGVNYVTSANPGQGKASETGPDAKAGAAGKAKGTSSVVANSVAAKAAADKAKAAAAAAPAAPAPGAGQKSASVSPTKSPPAKKSPRPMSNKGRGTIMPGKGKGARPGSNKGRPNSNKGRPPSNKGKTNNSGRPASNSGKPTAAA